MFFIERMPVWATDGQAADPFGGYGMILSMVALVAVFYFFIIRPESKRKKAAAQMRNELIVGDTITTVGGITGRVIDIKDDTLTLETGPDRTKIVIMRWAISTKGEQTTDNQR